MFGHVQYHREAEESYSGSEWQYIGIDELTRGWEERTYTFLMSRIRRPSEMNAWRMAAAPDGTTLADVPLRMRAATNPGGSGHLWVKRRFIDADKDPARIFVPSKLTDNPFVEQEAYTHALNQLSPVDRQRLLEGDWDVVEGGAVFSRDRFQFVDQRPTGKHIRWARCWDFAATDSSAKDMPDWTAGALVGMDSKNGVYYLADMVRVQLSADKVESLVANTARLDGKRVAIILEQDPGSAGKQVVDFFQRHVLQGFEVHGQRPSGAKSERARPWAAAANSGNLYFVSDPNHPAQWLDAAVREFELFPSPSVNDDQVDAVSGGFNWLSGQAGRNRIIV